MLAREVYVLYKFSKMDENTYTINVVDMQVNEEALTDPSKLTTLYIVTNFQEMDMSNLLYSKTNLTYEQVKILAYNLLITLRFIHRAGVIHRDLKPNNILINSHCQIILCDFGWSRTLPVPEYKKEGKNARRLSLNFSTRYYRSPEVILRYDDYDTRSDVWSYGCIVAELLRVHL